MTEFPTTAYPTAIDESAPIFLLLVILGLYLALFVCSIISYILTSLSLHTIGKRRLINNAWLAWIPIANYWVIGKIAEEYDGKNGINRKWGKILLTLAIIGVGVFIVSFIALMAIVIIAAIQSEVTGEEAFLGFIGVIIALYIVFILAALVVSVLGFLQVICIFKIFESTVPQKAVKYMIIYLLVPLGAPICLYLCRNQGYSNIPEPIAPAYLPQNNFTEEN